MLVAWDSDSMTQGPAIRNRGALGAEADVGDRKLRWVACVGEWMREQAMREWEVIQL